MAPQCRPPSVGPWGPPVLPHLCGGGRGAFRCAELPEQRGSCTAGCDLVYGRVVTQVGPDRCVIAPSFSFSFFFVPHCRLDSDLVWLTAHCLSEISGFLLPVNLRMSLHFSAQYQTLHRERVSSEPLFNEMLHPKVKPSLFSRLVEQTTKTSAVSSTLMIQTG